MAITHNVYFEGKVQSLGFTDAVGNDWTVGVLEPGEYEFDASRYEMVEVLQGVLKDHRTNKMHSAQSNPKLEHFSPGNTVHLSCKVVVVYRCLYADSLQKGL